MLSAEKMLVLKNYGATVYVLEIPAAAKASSSVTVDCACSI
jgi:hypothetical protein